MRNRDIRYKRFIWYVRKNRVFGVKGKRCEFNRVKIFVARKLVRIGIEEVDRGVKDDVFTMTNLAITTVRVDFKNNEVVEEGGCIEISNKMTLISAGMTNFSIAIFKGYVYINTGPEWVEMVYVDMFARCKMVGRVINPARVVERLCDACIRHGKTPVLKRNCRGGANIATFVFVAISPTDLSACP